MWSRLSGLVLIVVSVAVLGAQFRLTASTRESLEDLCDS
jgi:hypothetical protein